MWHASGPGLPLSRGFPCSERVVKRLVHGSAGGTAGVDRLNGCASRTSSAGLSPRERQVCLGGKRMGLEFLESILGFALPAMCVDRVARAGSPSTASAARPARPALPAFPAWPAARQPGRLATATRVMLSVLAAASRPPAETSSPDAKPVRLRMPVAWTAPVFIGDVVAGQPEWERSSTVVSLRCNASCQT